MTVEWSEKRWPGFVHALLRLFHAKAADQGALRIRLEEPAALGRMFLEDRDGAVLYALIDSSRTRDKWFYLPAETMENGAVLKNEAGDTLFTLAAGDRNAVWQYRPAARTDGNRAASPAPEETGPPEAVSTQGEADQTPPARTEAVQEETAQAAPIPQTETRTAEHQAPQPDEATGIEKKKGETES